MRRFLGLCILAITPIAYAQPDLTIDWLKTFRDIAVKCELNQVCIYDQLERRSLDKSDPLQAFFARQLFEFNQKTTKEQLLSLEQSCDSPELKTARKTIAECMPMIEFGNAKSIENMRETLNKKLTPLAEEGNLYALNILAKNTQDTKWQLELNKHRYTPEFQSMQQCTTDNFS